MGNSLTLGRKDIRVRAGVSIDGLARLAGCTASTVKKWERGEELAYDRHREAFRRLYEWMRDVPLHGATVDYRGMPV